MSFLNICKTYAAPKISEKEILRYAKTNTKDLSALELARNCLSELENKLKYMVCYQILNVKIQGNICDFGLFSIKSADLAKSLKNCSKVIVFAATVGVEIDRLINRYTRISPSRSLMLSAIGTERIEALCDEFCVDMIKQLGLPLTPRFSPGYGDLPLETQKDIFNILDCNKNLGISLNESLLISPSKSVTAFAGILDGDQL